MLELQEALELLRGGRDGVAEWNRRREEGEEIPDLSNVDLRHVDLRHVNLSDANLMDAYLFGVNLNRATLRGANLVGANLSHAKLNRCRLNGADLTFVNLRDAHLRGARMHKATLTGADFRGADFSRANIFSIVYDFSKMKGKFLGLRGLESCYGDAFFVRHARDQDFIETVARRMTTPFQRGLFWLWSLIDFGRSFKRVAIIGMTLWAGFAVIFYAFPKILDVGKSAESWFTPAYFSIVTLTTLGFGDVTPGNWQGEMVVAAEVLCGYLLLGLLVSIMADKIARRS